MLTALLNLDSLAEVYKIFLKLHKSTDEKMFAKYLSGDLSFVKPAKILLTVNWEHPFTIEKKQITLNEGLKWFATHNRSLKLYWKLWRTFVGICFLKERRTVDHKKNKNQCSNKHKFQNPFNNTFTYSAVPNCRGREVFWHFAFSSRNIILLHGT